MIVVRSGLARYLHDQRAQIVRFVLVGVATFSINFLTFHLCFGLLGWDYRFAVTFAYVVTVCCHFFLNRTFTFAAGEQRLFKNAGRYCAMLFVNYLATLSITTATVEVFGLSPYFGVIASTAATASLSFFIMKYFVFRDELQSCRS